MDISFLILSDGKCTSKSFRPKEDKTQWCQRRDALSRITCMTLCQGPGVRHRCTSSCTLIFNNVHDNDSNDKTESVPAVIRMDAELMNSGDTHMSEGKLIKIWRNATLSAEQNAAINPFSSSRTIGKSFCTCSLSPWIFAELSYQRANKDGSRSINNSSNVDKRTMIATMQRLCPISFLREHGLNGSESLLLKNKSRQAVIEAYQKWTTISEDSRGQQKDLESIDKLEATFIALLQCELRSSNSVTLLVLHEDHQYELPVFGPLEDLLESNCQNQSHNQNSNNRSRAAGISDRAMDSSSSPLCSHSHRVVCAMGAVRDMTTAELSALLRAAGRLHVRTVCANLGRVAEFTSKIAAALAGHALAGRLGPAIDRLLQQHHGSSSSSDFIDSTLQLLERDGVPGRSSAQILPSSRPSKCPSPVCIHVALWLPFARTEVCTDISKRDDMMELVQVTVCALWRSRIASECAVTSERTGSNKRHGSASSSVEAVQPEGKRAHDRGEEEEMKKRDEKKGREPASGVVNTLLSLVFKDGSVFSVSQADFCRYMMTRHRAAPSEYQVLETLCEMIQAASFSSSNAAGTVAAAAAGEFSVLDRLLLDADRISSESCAIRGVAPKKKNPKLQLRVLELCGLCPVHYSTSHDLHDSSCDEAGKKNAGTGRILSGTSTCPAFKRRLGQDSLLASSESSISEKMLKTSANGFSRATSAIQQCDTPINANDAQTNILALSQFVYQKKCRCASACHDDDFVTPTSCDEKMIEQSKKSQRSTHLLVLLRRKELGGGGAKSHTLHASSLVTSESLRATGRFQVSSATVKEARVFPSFSGDSATLANADGAAGKPQRQQQEQIYEYGGLVSPAIAVTMLQHWGYHGRLLPAVYKI